MRNISFALAAILCFFHSIERAYATTYVIELGLADTVSYYNSDHTFQFRFLPSDCIKHHSTAARGEFCRLTDRSEWEVMWGDSFLWSERIPLVVVSNDGKRVAMFHTAGSADNIWIFDNSGARIRSLDRRDITPVFSAPFPVISDTTIAEDDFLVSFDEFWPSEPFEFVWGFVDSTSPIGDTLRLRVFRYESSPERLDSDLGLVDILFSNGRISSQYPLLGGPKQFEGKEGPSVLEETHVKLPFPADGNDYRLDRDRFGSYLFTAIEYFQSWYILHVCCIDSSLIVRWTWISDTLGDLCNSEGIFVKDGCLISASANERDSTSKLLLCKTTVYLLNNSGELIQKTTLGFTKDFEPAITESEIVYFTRNPFEDWPNPLKQKTINSVDISRMTAFNCGEYVTCRTLSEGTIVRLNFRSLCFYDNNGLAQLFVNRFDELDVVSPSNLWGARCVTFDNRRRNLYVVKFTENNLRGATVESLSIGSDKLITSCAAADQGGTLVAGNSTAPFGDYDLFLSKLDSNSNIEWTFQYGTGDLDVSCLISVTGLNKYRLAAISRQEFLVFDISE